MNNEQILLNKWRTLPSQKQQKVLDLVEQLDRQNQDINQANIYQPKTDMGKKLWEIRCQAITEQSKLLSWDEIEEEISESWGEKQ
ncbi:MAG: hypothetical protein F6K25_16600 [Okeania sp. SIO2G4]|uniref:hypothetical protein n=1 Tax=unclassified Okeania TaxID=2634635 RepID=UPI0013BAB6C9|nr:MULTISPECIES: hypothetical protein [unclassified Okeania]NEP04506.1 hypothetical protein [Okeania sp. SIO4D6]NEP42532.1 hypothetical protein [Okeania sp. SIO2H7]NEP73669.1 hypothetical protein [Okeania sp. SIO2G5]NEP94381.1 hypothetical protein [Okeania sp. SIO2F5]NEQ92229.1 hypothetical protein [Okeania sp. SIO2G4]